MTKGKIKIKMKANSVRKSHSFAITPQCTLLYNHSICYVLINWILAVENWPKILWGRVHIYVHILTVWNLMFSRFLSLILCVCVCVCKDPTFDSDCEYKKEKHVLGRVRERTKWKCYTRICMCEFTITENIQQIVWICVRYTLPHIYGLYHSHAPPPLTTICGTRSLSVERGRKKWIANVIAHHSKNPHRQIHTQ